MSQAFDCLLQRSRKLAITTAVDPQFTRARPAQLTRQASEIADQ
jgi:hypothetical protein